MRTIRSFSKYFAACGLALAVLFYAASSQAAPTKGVATVSTVKGDAKYSDASGKWQEIKAGIQLPEGATIRTGPGSYVYLAVNSKTSAVRVNENTVMKLEKMEQLNNAEGDHDTVLDIQSGTAVGDIKKLSKASHFDVRTPHGLAGIRGTAWAITVTVSVGNTVLSKTTIYCVNGQVSVQTVVNGVTITIPLIAGQSVVLTGNQTSDPIIGHDIFNDPLIITVPDPDGKPTTIEVIVTPSPTE
jgi:hypothetical protein